MPTRNPWLADSVSPISHFNPAATDAIEHPGPTHGRQLTASDVSYVLNIYTSNATVKTEGDDTIVIAAGLDGIRKINATGDSFDLVSFVAYPGLEMLSEIATPEALESALEDTDRAVREKDDAKILALSERLAQIGFSRRYLLNGLYNLIDSDGFHYAAFGGLKIIKTTDDNDPAAPLRVVAVADFSSRLPEELAGGHIIGLGMTYDGHLAAVADGVLILLDRDLEMLGTLMFPGEAVENGLCTDETGIYVVTSHRMRKVVWTGKKLSSNEADGGWESAYNTTSPERAIAAGSIAASGGSGTTPALLGFGRDTDTLVVIADADPDGTNVVAFWRDKIPDGFVQKPGTKSRRIADQIRTDISKSTIEQSPNILGNGVLVVNTSYPEPVADLWGNAMTAGVTRPAPTGVEKLEWDSATRSFHKVWSNREIDNTDVVVPVVSAATEMVYFASKDHGRHEYVALDWNTGELKARWPFPDASRIWNAFGGGNAVLPDGDLLLGGLFALKRVRIGDRLRHFSVDHLRRRAIARRAFESALWGMSIVSFDLMAAGLGRAGGEPGQILYWSRLPDWKNQTLTPNPDVIYLMPFFDTRDGPVVLEIPPADDGSITGTIMDAWQAALEDVGPSGFDRGRGGRYLVLPPGYTAQPPPGFIPLQSDTFAGFALLRSIPRSGRQAHIDKAVAYGKRIALYPLSRADAPPASVFVDAADTEIDATLRYDMTFFEALHRAVQREPWLERDAVMIDLLKTVGIAKGEPFAPDRTIRAVLDEAIAEVHAWLDARLESAFAPFYDGGHWVTPSSAEIAETQATFFERPGVYSLDARALLYSYTFSSVKHLGAGQFYMFALRDHSGSILDGSTCYRLVVPPEVPASQYWSATVYDRATHALIRGLERSSRSSQTPGLQPNRDGSVDLYFGPQPPRDLASNWVPTNAGGVFEVVLRFYGPRKPLFDKTWRLPDIEALKADRVSC